MRFVLFSLLILASINHARSSDDLRVRKAVETALPLLNTTSIKSAAHRKCYTCHGQGLPILTFVEAKKRGFQIDEENLNRQVSHTVAHLTSGKENYRKGIGQGGKADMAGSALWAIKSAGYQRSDVTDAVVNFLIVRNANRPHWISAADRPPSEGSEFTSTFLALQGLEAYEFPEKQEAIEKRRESSRKWLKETEPESTEDAVHQLRALTLLKSETSNFSQALTVQQRTDGGWGQLPDLPSDAYATASVLVALFESGNIDVTSELYLKGIHFLLESQLPDGSWHVQTRSSPIQKYYESGFPHGEDQFISTNATALAALALLYTLPEGP